MKQKKIIEELCAAHAMELETVQNYIAAASVKFIGFLKENEKK